MKRLLRVRPTSSKAPKAKSANPPAKTVEELAAKARELYGEAATTMSIHDLRKALRVGSDKATLVQALLRGGR